MTGDAIAEIWRDVAGFEGAYQISSRRRVRSLKRTVTRSNGVPCRVRRKVLRQYEARGAARVSLVKPGERRLAYVDQLYREAFPPPPAAGR